MALNLEKGPLLKDNLLFLFLIIFITIDQLMNNKIINFNHHNFYLSYLLLSTNNNKMINLRFL